MFFVRRHPWHTFPFLDSHSSITLIPYSLSVSHIASQPSHFLSCIWHDGSQITLTDYGVSLHFPSATASGNWSELMANNSLLTEAQWEVGGGGDRCCHPGPHPPPPPPQWMNQRWIRWWWRRWQEWGEGRERGWTEGRIERGRKRRDIVIGHPEEAECQEAISLSTGVMLLLLLP